jgi:hypothetical protein
LLRVVRRPRRFPPAEQAGKKEVAAGYEVDAADWEALYDNAVEARSGPRRRSVFRTA